MWGVLWVCEVYCGYLRSIVGVWGYCAYVRGTYCGCVRGTAGMWGVLWVCEGYCGYVRGTVGMSGILWVCEGYCGYVRGTVGMWGILWVCEGYCGYVRDTVGMWGVLWVCEGYCGYVRDTVGMWGVLWVCQGYCGYVRGTVGMWEVLWVCEGRVCQLMCERCRAISLSAVEVLLRCCPSPASHLCRSWKSCPVIPQNSSHSPCTLATTPTHTMPLSITTWRYRPTSTWPPNCTRPIPGQSLHCILRVRTWGKRNCSTGLRTSVTS